MRCSARRPSATLGSAFLTTTSAISVRTASSFLKTVSAVLTERGWRLGNLDATVIAQRPKLAPYIDAMRAHIADALGADVSAVSVKATTEEHLGFTGDGSGIAAHAVCLIEPL